MHHEVGVGLLGLGVVGILVTQVGVAQERGTQSLIHPLQPDPRERLANPVGPQRILGVRRIPKQVSAGVDRQPFLDDGRHGVVHLYRFLTVFL